MSNGIDDFYSSPERPDEFIKDISKKMQVPHRISFGTKEMLTPPLSSVDLLDHSTMKVPDRIKVSDLALTSGKGDSGPKITEIDLIDDLDLFPRHSPRSSLAPPPTSLVLNEVDYPDVDRLRKETAEEQALTAVSVESAKPHSPAPSEFMSKTSMNHVTSSPNQVNNSATLTIDPTADDRRFRVLEKRIARLEHEQARRKQWDQLSLLAVGVYMVIKLFRAML